MCNFKRKIRIINKLKKSKKSRIINGHYGRFYTVMYKGGLIYGSLNNHLHSFGILNII